MCSLSFVQTHDWVVKEHVFNKNNHKIELHDVFYVVSIIRYRLFLISGQSPFNV